MALRNSKALTFRPKGVSDSVDGTNAFSGALQAAQNIIPANDTMNTWVPRPAAVRINHFADFDTPGFVSASLVVGNIEYGMVASALNPGYDEPYAFNLSTLTFLTITGITAGNVPASPATSGAWTPPILAVIGTRVIVTHPGFPGSAVKFGWFDISSFTANVSTTTNGTTTLASATSLLQDGVQPGQVISKADVPVGTRVISIAADGLSLVMSASATGSTTSAASFTGGTPTSPQWDAGDTNINPLPSVPVSVAQFNGRAYFACGVNGTPFSDALLPCNRTNATQALTFANGLPVTALGALPLASPITGGIVQSIIAFQGISAMQQITGDPATTNLATNVMNVATGTLAPLSIVPTNFGLAFISPEGLRIVSFAAQVSDPIGYHGQGVSLPFIYAVQPSRICAAATSDVLRISVQNGFAAGQPNQEYWFDIAEKVWSGPHTFPASLIQPWGDTFVVHPLGIPATTWRSDVNPSANTTYTENGVALSWTLQTTLLPDNEAMCENAMIESTVAVALPSGYHLVVTAADELGVVLGTAQIQTAGAATIWDEFYWGTAPWSSNVGAFRQYRVPWPAPVVYKQATEMLQGLSVANLKIGNSYFRYQELGYLVGVPYAPFIPKPPAPFILDVSVLDGPDVLG